MRSCVWALAFVAGELSGGLCDRFRSQLSLHALSGDQATWSQRPNKDAKQSWLLDRKGKEEEFKFQETNIQLGLWTFSTAFETCHIQAAVISKMAADAVLFDQCG